MGAAHRVTAPPKQSLGQNFLVDDNIARNIVRDLHLMPNDIVVEIGPGNGALTVHLLGQGKHLIAVEIDLRVLDELRRRISGDGVTLLHQDFLDAPLEEWARQHGARLRIVGNIPYHVTSSILFKIFDSFVWIQDLTMMVQREVAQRIVAVPCTKAYGILSVMARFYGTPRLLFNVSPNCFYPKPKVTSTVVQLRLHSALPFRLDEALFKTVVRTTFGKRRKTLRNSLQYLPFDPTTVENIVHSLRFSLERRPEELSVEEFADLTQQISPLLQQREEL